jgi:4-hydroxy-3-methylbut-2-enyl diphosphate reductase
MRCARLAATVRRGAGGRLAQQSSNSNRLRELAEKQGVPAYLIDGADDIDPAWLAGRKRIGVTAGASAPDVLVQGVLERPA